MLSKVLFLLGLSVFVTHCTSFEGKYEDPDKVEIVDDRWNDSDARVFAERMIKSALAKPWLADFVQNNKGKKPVILVGDFENRTSEQIDTTAVFEAVRNELMNSGRVQFVDGKQRDNMAKEIEHQAKNASKAKGKGKQASADFFLVGSLSSIVSQLEGKKRVTYQLEMRLTNIESSVIEWTEVSKITKQFKRSKVGS